MITMRGERQERGEGEIREGRDKGGRSFTYFLMHVKQHFQSRCGGFKYLWWLLITIE